jgi:hypothetical protein
MEITVRSEKSFALHDPVKSAYVYAIQLYYLSIMLFPDDALRACLETLHRRENFIYSF